MSAHAVQLEIAANSLASARAAQEGGADRIELFENLGEGGCTPSAGTIAIARGCLRIPLHVLIRPRAGDFIYDALEVDVMLRDIAVCRELRCDGVVIGALAVDGSIDVETCRALIDAAAGMSVTFHRAFDAVPDSAIALETLIALGCNRVLTSGGAADALSGASHIAALHAQAADRIRILAGAGITASNVASLVARTGVREVHASAKALRISTTTHRATALTGLDPDWTQSDVSHVRALRQALDGVDASIR